MTFFNPTGLSKERQCQQEDDWNDMSAADHFCEALLEMHTCFFFVVVYFLPSISSKATSL